MHCRPAPVSFRSLVAMLAGGVALMATVAAPAAAAAPPPAPSHPVSETMHGIVVVDPYRNLEDLKSAETQAWLKAEGEIAAEQLARIPGRDAMARRIQALADATGDTVREVVRMPGERIYYLKRKAGQSQLKLFMRHGLGGAEQLLVDPEQMAKATGVPHAISYFVPSWDGRTLAYGISAGGSEDASLYLLDIASGKAIGAPIPRVHEDLVHWAPDSKSLSFNQLRELPAGAADSETYLDSTVYLLQVGDAAARPLFGPLVDKSLKLDRLDVAEVLFAPDSAYMIARTTDTTLPEGKLFVAPVAELASPHIAWQAISGFADHITAVQLRGDTLYLRTYASAPRGRILALALKSPVLASAIEVVPEPDAGVLRGFDLGSDAIYAEVQQGFTTRVRRYAAGGAAQGRDVTAARVGSAALAGDPAHAHQDVWIVNRTWTDPSRLLAARGDGVSTDTGLYVSRRPPGTPELEVSEVLVPSWDGAKVPLAILRRKGLTLDGTNPTLLHGYGAYGLSFETFFDPRAMAWLEKGGVLAFANVRGSSAFGDAWYRAGFKATKPNTWKDGIACARYLVAQRYGSPKTLGVLGGSAGGIFVGRAVTSAPELFAAAIFEVGEMDTLRSEFSANGITNISEFGTVKDPAEFKALLEMSTYAHVKDGVAYPAVLLIHGLNDPRVDVWHSAKATARLQAATTSHRPVLLRLDSQAGHGIGSTAQQGFSKEADIYSFLLWQFGKTTLPP